MLDKRYKDRFSLLFILNQGVNRDFGIEIE